MKKKKVLKFLRIVLPVLFFWYFAISILGNITFFWSSLFLYFAYSIRGKTNKLFKILFPFLIFAGLFIVLRNYIVYKNQLNGTIIFLFAGLGALVSGLLMRSPCLMAKIITRSPCPKAAITTRQSTIRGKAISASRTCIVPWSVQAPR